MKNASDPAILLAMEKSLAMIKDMVRVLAIANTLHSIALARLLPMSSAPFWRPAWLLFINLSPMNIVADLEKKSEPTIESAVDKESEKLKLVMNVTKPAISLHVIDFANDREVVSEKLADGTVTRSWLFK